MGHFAFIKIIHKKINTRNYVFIESIFNHVLIKQFKLNQIDKYILNNFKVFHDFKILEKLIKLFHYNLFK